jgi:shikimate kinase
MLAGKDVRVEIEKLMLQRSAAYARAHHTIDTTGLVPSAVARQIQEALENPA